MNSAQKRKILTELVEMLRSDKVTIDQAVDMIEAAVQAALAGQLAEIKRQCIEVLLMPDLKGDGPDHPSSSRPIQGS